MPKFRITKVYVVEAADEAAAYKLTDREAGIEWISIRPADHDPKGWGRAIINQVTGRTAR